MNMLEGWSVGSTACGVCGLQKYNSASGPAEQYIARTELYMPNPSTCCTYIQCHIHVCSASNTSPTCVFRQPPKKSTCIYFLPVLCLSICLSVCLSQSHQFCFLCTVHLGRHSGTDILPRVLQHQRCFQIIMQSQVVVFESCF